MEGSGGVGRWGGRLSLSGQLCPSIAHSHLAVFQILIVLVDRFSLYHLNLFKLLSRPLVPSILVDAKECSVLAH